MVLAVIGHQFDLLSHSVHLGGPLTQSMWDIYVCQCFHRVVELCRHRHGDDTAGGAGLAM